MNSTRSILEISKLLDNYLLEVALGPNLLAYKLIALAEVLPDHARVASDGLYRAVDIFLKILPNMKDSKKYLLYKSIDGQKLLLEACSHVAQNDRLPIQTAVQVFYFKQIRLRNTMMKMRLTDLEKDHALMKQELVRPPRASLLI